MISDYCTNGCTHYNMVSDETHDWWKHYANIVNDIGLGCPLHKDFDSKNCWLNIESHLNTHSIEDSILISLVGYR